MLASMVVNLFKVQPGSPLIRSSALIDDPIVVTREEYIKDWEDFATCGEALLWS